jgi:hypothetical protein
MSIITISRGSYSRGKEVAERVSQLLNYRCISREIILRASEQFNVPEVKLIRGIHDAPSILDRFTYGKERYVAYFRSSLLTRMQRDNVVYHGLAGHFFLQRVPHVLKVRILSDLEDRVEEEMRRENISAEKARFIIKKDDEERRRWSLHLYGVDTWDPGLYDLVLHIKPLSVKDAANIIVYTVKLPCFKTTPESQKILNELALAALVQAELVDEFPNLPVSAKEETIFVGVKPSLCENEQMLNKIETIIRRKVGRKVKIEFTIESGILFED